MKDYKTRKAVLITALARAAGSRPSTHSDGRRVILCYHSIHPSRPFASATPELFAEHLSWLKENTDVVSLTDIRVARPSGRPLVAITFDDGYDDNFNHAFPLLSRHGIVATFFVTAGLLERDEAVVDRLAALNRCARENVVPLSWEQVREMSSAGAEIGSHTYGHPNLAALGYAETASELISSKEILEQRLQEAVTVLAYPFGKPRRHFSSATQAAASAAGYERAVAVITRGVRPFDSEMELPRVVVDGDDLTTLGQKVSGGWDFVGSWQERAPLWAVRMLRPGDSASDLLDRR